MEKLTKQEEEVMLQSIGRLGNCTTKEYIATIGGTQTTLYNRGFGDEQPEAQRVYSGKTAWARSIISL